MLRKLLEGLWWWELILSLNSICCHNITLLRGCMVAGLPLPCIKAGALGYKSTGRSRIYESKTTINIINLPSCRYAPPVNLDRLWARKALRTPHKLLFYTFIKPYSQYVNIYVLYLIEWLYQTSARQGELHNLVDQDWEHSPAQQQRSLHSQ